MRWILPTLLLLPLGCSEATEASTKAPPPISGGTLIITDDGAEAIAADPDQDRVFIVDAETTKVLHDIALESGDEPGRLDDDADGRVHVALRSAGDLVTIERATGRILRRQPVCTGPRGVAYEPSLDAVHVACLTGELVTVRASNGEEIRRLRLERDLRDIVVGDDGLTVSRFRSAEMLEVDSLGVVASKNTLPQSFDTSTFQPAVAWRTQALPGGGAVVAHQRAMLDTIQLPRPGVPQGTYGSVGGSSQAPGIVQTVISLYRPDQPVPPEAQAPPALPLAMLPVDVAVASDGSYLALAAAGSGTVLTLPIYAAQLNSNDLEHHAVEGQPVAVAFDAQDRVWVQTRRPAGVHLLGQPLVPLGQEPEQDGDEEAAHDMFHLTTGTLGALSCASCHPEGSDDGRVWSFLPHDSSDTVVRRTQTLRGGLTNGPYHWDGLLPDFDALVQDVMVARMGAPDPGAGRTAALADFLIAMPPLPREVHADAAMVERGRALFHAADVGCASCHNGNKLTNDETVDVGTGGPLQVPTLVGIAHHAPFMHNGCAPTLADRFGPCGGGDAHGKTSHLSASQLSDLIAYLETL